MAKPSRTGTRITDTDPILICHLSSPRRPVSRPARGSQTGHHPISWLASIVGTLPVRASGSWTHKSRYLTRPFDQLEYVTGAINLPLAQSRVVQETKNTRAWSWSWTAKSHFGSRRSKSCSDHRLSKSGTDRKYQLECRVQCRPRRSGED